MKNGMPATNRVCIKIQDKTVKNVEWILAKHTAKPEHMKGETSVKGAATKYENMMK